jgi:hypothetical protein
MEMRESFSYTTLTLERWMAPKHIGHGSQDAYISQSESSIRFSFLHACEKNYIIHASYIAGITKAICTPAQMTQQGTPSKQVNQGKVRV